MIVDGIDVELIHRLTATAEAVAAGTCGSTLVVLVGHSGAGKTATVQRFRDDLVRTVPGAAGWPAIELGAAHFLESRKWVDPRASSAVPPDGGAGCPDAAEVPSPADTPATDAEDLDAPTRPWIWIGLECGPDAAGEPGGLSTARGRLRQLVAAHETASVGGGGDSEAPVDDDELARCLVDLARDRPMVIAADDLHAADAETVLWLRHILQEAPVCVVGTAWPQSIDEGPLGVLSSPMPGVHIEMVEVDLPGAVAFEEILEEHGQALGYDERATVLKHVDRNPLALRVILDSLALRDAFELGVRVDAESLAGLTGGDPDELADVWASLPQPVRDALDAAADFGADWVRAAVRSIVQAAAESVLAEIAGDHPAQTWVAELDEQLAVWVDPVLQQLAIQSGGRPLSVDELIELHRWVVDSALAVARRWVPNDRAALQERRAALRAEGFLPTPVAEPAEDREPEQGTPTATEDTPQEGTEGGGHEPQLPDQERAEVPVPAVAPPPAGDTSASPAVRTSLERTARVDQLAGAVRSCDVSQFPDLALAIEVLLRECRLEEGPMAPNTMRLEIARSAMVNRPREATQALESLRPLMALALDLHGTDGKPVLEGRWNGVLLLRRVRRRGDAVREADCLVRSLTRAVGPTHEETISARALLAETLGAAGLHRDAVKLYGELTRDLSEQHGVTSVAALAAYLGWADALFLAGRRADAVALLRQADATADSCLASDNPLRRRIRRHLARMEEGRVGASRRNERRFGRSLRPITG